MLIVSIQRRACSPLVGTSRCLRFWLYFLRYARFGRRPSTTLASRWRHAQSFQCPTLNCTQVPVNSTPCCCGSTGSQFVYLALQLPILFDQLGDNHIELMNKLFSAQAPRSTSWHSYSPLPIIG